MTLFQLSGEKVYCRSNQLQTNKYVFVGCLVEHFSENHEGHRGVKPAIRPRDDKLGRPSTMLSLVKAINLYIFLVTIETKSSHLTN